MADRTITLTTEEIAFVLNVLHVDGHGHGSSKNDFEPDCPSCTAAEKLEALEAAAGVSGTALTRAVNRRADSRGVTR